MAFPSVVTRATSLDDAADVTSHTITLPSGIVSGDLIIILCAVDGAPTVTWGGTGFTEFFQAAKGTDVTLAMAYRHADGTEGASIEITTGSAERSAHIAYRISGATSVVPEAGSSATGVNSAPNPSNHTPTGGAKDYLWLAVEGNDRDRVVTLFPFNYTDGQNSIGHASEFSACVGSAERQLNAASEDAGGFNLTTSEQWVAVTVSIAPGVVPIAPESLLSRIRIRASMFGRTSRRLVG